MLNRASHEVKHADARVNFAVELGETEKSNDVKSAVPERNADAFVLCKQ